ncbi:MAG: hypothetical protein GY856_48415, partial [bacterium]|nr:hypothetical protein [bacterium]
MTRGVGQSTLRSFMTLILLIFYAVIAGAESAVPDFKIFLSDPGVYKVSYEELAAAGLEGEEPRSAGLGLRSAGQPVAVWVEDGGDGRFGPGDRLEFVGESLRGEVSYYHEYANFNVYVLSWDDPEPARMHRAELAAWPAGEFQSSYSVHEHLEQDRLLPRFGSHGQEPEDLWYWAKLSHIDKEPFREVVSLRALARDSSRPVSLRLHFRAWSKPSRKPDPEIADHRLEVSLNGVPVGSGEWNGDTGFVLTIPSVPGDALKSGKNVLAITVPKRMVTLREEPEPLIDVVLLNWIEVTYPRHPGIGGRQVRIELPDHDAGRPRLLVTAGEQKLSVYGADGTRIDPSAIERRELPEGRIHHLFSLPGAASMFVVPEGALREPPVVVLGRPTHLVEGANQADYLMIVHPRLIAAIEPLAEFHRRRGLSVEVVDVVDVYDEFNHGIFHPRAIRDFLDHAYHHWTSPRPRFVLLVGDASWDTKNEDPDDVLYANFTYRPGAGGQFRRMQSATYETSSELKHRNLVPTWSYFMSEGHAASDNWFVAVDGDGDDFHPDMAIGRFPVTEPEEVAAIVEKTIRYASNEGLGPWRRNLLWIANENPGFQKQTDQLVEPLVRRGFAPVKVYPSLEESSNERHQEAISRALNRGQLLVHFFGHGGRFIWRTAPPDFKKNRDLFTLDHLDQLEPTAGISIILSMTCYSAPFDHPNADSIGEKFLRLPDRGAVAVLAASWRNSPRAAFSRALLEELTSPGALGEAIMRAKQAYGFRDLIEQYNLLGDPATPVALPRLAVKLT